MSGMPRYEYGLNAGCILTRSSKIAAEGRGVIPKEYISSVEKGIKEGKLKVAAFGDTKPLAPNDTDEGKAQNRRVEIKIEF